ncbi:MAG TPA: ribbon-helix-helix domain-containing protein [Nocardioidaceae bacterium]|jgi:Arc/MetJ-type ribon-helix-helix transcriptional regulator
MTTQITVRLPDELVAFVDRLVSEGAASRAAVVTRALNLYQQQVRGEQDARILEKTGDYDDFDELVVHASIEPDA